MNGRARDEAGFTLPELLVAITITMTVVLGTFALVEYVLKRTAATQARVEATQRGRLALDVMTRQLRSQVCLGPAAPAVLEAKADRITFHADLGDGTTPPTKRVLYFDSTRGRLMEETYAGVGMPPSTTYPGSPRVSELVSGVSRDGAKPFFSYFAYTDGTPPRPELALAAPVAAADLGRTARISIAFVTRAGSRSVTPAAVTLTDDVYVRTADPNDPAPYPTCA